MKLKRKSDIDNLSDLEQQDASISFGSFKPIELPLVRKQFTSLFSDNLVDVVPKNTKKYKPPKLNPRKQKYIHK